MVGRLTAASVHTLLTACTVPRRPSELQQMLGVKDRVLLLHRYLAPLIEQGWLARTQPRSPRSPTQRYATTDAGQGWLAAQGQGADEVGKR